MGECQHEEALRSDEAMMTGRVVCNCGVILQHYQSAPDDGGDWEEIGDIKDEA